MITTGVIVLLALAGVAILAKGKISMVSEAEQRRADYSGREPVATTRSVRVLGLIPLAVALVLLILASTYRVGTGEAVIKVSPANAYLSTDADTGYHVKAPWTKTETWDLRNNKVEFGDGVDDAKGGTIRTATKDPVDTWFNMTVTYDLTAGGLRNAFNQYRTQDALEENQIVPAFRSKAKDAPTAFTAVEIRGQRPALSQQMQADLTSRLTKYGVNVSTVDLQDIGLPKVVIDNLNTVQAKAAEAQAKRSELDAANIDAEKERVAAKGQADADQITRCGATTEAVTEKVNGKDTQVVRVVPNATCDPNRLNTAVLAARYIEMLEKRSGDTSIVLPSDVQSIINFSGAPAAAK